MRTSTPRLALGLLVGLALLVAPSPPAEACLHPAGSGAKPVTQSGQQAIVLHDGKVEDLILRVDYEGLDAPSLAWVVPVPAVPTRYEALEPGLFDEVGRWVNLRREPARRPRSRRKRDGPTPASTPALTLLPEVKVGPFQIQPIKAQGPQAAAELNGWMTENGFAAIPDASLAYYVERSWTFLAIKIDPKAGGAFDSRGGLSPLHLTQAWQEILAGDIQAASTIAEDDELAIRIADACARRRAQLSRACSRVTSI